MPRLGRYFVIDQAQYVVQRGHNLQKIFLSVEDYARYSEYLVTAAGTYGCAIHAYVFMPSEIHLLITPSGVSSLPRMFQSLGRRYVRHFNSANGRTGTLWDGRYRAVPIDADMQFLECCRHMETLPVRAGLADHPRNYHLSSYNYHAVGAPSIIVTMHSAYRKLGISPAVRQQAYRTQFRKPLDPGFARSLRAAVDGGWVLGDDAFKAEIAEASGRRTAPLRRGRRPKMRGKAAAVPIAEQPAAEPAANSRPEQP